MEARYSNMTDTCGICLEDLKTPIGIMDGCRNHEFCYDCLHKWITTSLTTSPLCPMCRKRITKIARKPRTSAQNICWERADIVVDRRYDIPLFIRIPGYHVVRGVDQIFALLHASRHAFRQQRPIMLIGNFIFLHD